VSYLDPAAAWAAGVGAVAPGPTGPRLQAGVVARVLLRYQLKDLSQDEEYEAVLFPAPEQSLQLSPLVVDYDDRDLVPGAPANARYVLPTAKIGAKTYWSTLSKDLTDHLVANESLEVLSNPDLKLFARVGESPEEFAARCQQVAAAEADKKAAPLRTKYEGKLRTLQTRLAGASTRAQQASAAVSGSVMDSAASVLGGFLGGRRSVSSISAAARRAQSAKSRADAAQAKVDEVQMQINDLEAELTAELQALDAEWTAKAASIAPVEVTLKRTQIRVADLRLVWFPVSG